MATAQKQMTQAPGIQHLVVKYKDQIEAALPKHISADRIARIALTLTRRNAKLAQADQVSLFGAIIQASQLGLEIGTHAHLVPFWNRYRKIDEIEVIPDYRGLIHLARNAGVGRFFANAVYQGDTFAYTFGTNQELRHAPGQQRGAVTRDDGSVVNRDDKITHFYAYAELAGGAPQFEVMTVDEVRLIQSRSKSGKDGPWMTDFEMMGRKTVAKRLCKYLPSSPELQRALELDDIAEASEPQALGTIIDVSSFGFEPEEPAPTPQRGAAALSERLSAENGAEPEQVPPKTEKTAPAGSQELSGHNGELLPPGETPPTIPEFMKQASAVSEAWREYGDTERATLELDRLRSQAQMHYKGNELGTISKAINKAFREVAGNGGS